MSRRGWLMFIALGVIWGVPYLLIKVAVRDIDPVLVVIGRTLIGGLLLLPLALHRQVLMPVLRRWRALLLYTVVEISGPWFFLGHAETKLNSSTSGLLLAVVPIVATIILVSSRSERFDLRRAIGLAIGLAGVALLVGLDIHVDDLLSVGFVMLTAIGYAFGPIIIARKLSDLPPLGVVTVSLLFAAVLYAPLAPWLWPTTVAADSALSVLALAVICTAVAFLVFFALIAEVGPARSTVVTYLNPAVAIVLGIAVLGEPFTVGMAIGFPLVIIGSILATARSRGAGALSNPTGESPVTVIAASPGRGSGDAPQRVRRPTT